jgi:hypothetical protein
MRKVNWGKSDKFFFTFFAFEQFSPRIWTPELMIIRWLEYHCTIYTDQIYENNLSEMI